MSCSVIAGIAFGIVGLIAGTFGITTYLNQLYIKFYLGGKSIYKKKIDMSTEVEGTRVDYKTEVKATEFPGAKSKPAEVLHSSTITNEEQWEFMRSLPLSQKQKDQLVAIMMEKSLIKSEK